MARGGHPGGLGAAVSSDQQTRRLDAAEKLIADLADVYTVDTDQSVLIRLVDRAKRYTHAIKEPAVCICGNGWTFDFAANRVYCRACEGR